MTTTTLPAPLTPAECNLQDFAFMPLDVARLRDSDMAAYESPEACWAAVLLWSAAWHQVPAASLPDDDRFLAKAAGYGRVVKEWANVREGALHGWIKCADGRLYHPVVAEKALESWKAKLNHQWKKECDRVRKSNKQREAEGRPPLPLPPEPGSHSDNIPLETAAIPLESVGSSNGNEQTSDGIPLEKALKGQGEGQGQGQGELKPKSSSPQTPTPDAEQASPESPADLVGGMARNVQIALLLRAQGVITTAQNPIVAVTWAQNPKITDEVLNVAIIKAKAAKPGESIPVKYLAPIVDQLLSEQAAPVPPMTPPGQFRLKSVAEYRPPAPQGTDPKGLDESYEAYEARIAAAELARRKGANP